MDNISIEKEKSTGKRSVFVDIDKRVELFKKQHAEMFYRRSLWLGENPEYSQSELQELDTESCRGKNILVISPHPDDEMIGCGGTLIKMLQTGAMVTVLQLTDGSRTKALEGCPDDIRKTIRLKEAEEVSNALGFSELILWKETDSNLQCTADNIKKLTAILNDLRPKAVFVPFIDDPHEDHIAANQILKESLKDPALDLPKVDILSYEVWSLVPPNLYCIIDEQFEKKVQTLRKYRTGMKVFDYVKFCESLNSYEGYSLLKRKLFAEVFLNLDAETYISLHSPAVE